MTRRAKLIAELESLDHEELTGRVLECGDIELRHREQLRELCGSLAQGRRGEYTEVQVGDLRSYLADLTG